MFEVQCSECKELRLVTAKKSWMIGELPYIKICKKCVGKGKSKSEETKKKLSAAVKLLQTDEVRKKKSDFMKQHPELWGNLQPELGPISRVGTHHTDKSKQKISHSNTGKIRTEEVKNKISQTMKNKNKENKN